MGDQSHGARRPLDPRICNIGHDTNALDHDDEVDLPPSQGVRLYEPVDALRATVVYWRCVLVPDADAL